MGEVSVTNLRVFDDPSENAPDPRVRFPFLLIIVIEGGARTACGTTKFPAGGSADIWMRTCGEDGLEMVEEYVANKGGVWLANLRDRKDV
jgi:hypothetical protein